MNTKFCNANLVVNNIETQQLQVSDNETHYLNIVLDSMGFSRYHKLIFIITALILICGGVQELMLAILLSLINEKQSLTEYHLALVNTTEYLG